MNKSLWMWFGFFAVVIILLILDLGVFHRRQRIIEIKDSLCLSAFYIAISLLFGVFVWYELGPVAGQNYFTGYLIEKSLSMDNIFVISLIFLFFDIPRQFQHRVLFWGILGVIILRAILIGVGSILVREFSWVLYIFAAFLLFTGVRMLFMKEKDNDFSDNFILRLAQKYLRVTDKLHAHHFFVRLPSDNSKKYMSYATPLFLALVLIEFTDVIFAVDSVPAIFAITTDPYIVYTSNIFAILGLRALYFSLATMIHRFEYLKYALALILIFIGVKVYLTDFFHIEKFPPILSLGITLLLLAGGIVFSLGKTKAKKKL